MGTATGAQVGAAAAATGGLFGGTVGATVDLADTGLKADYIDAVSGRLLPGHAALVAEVEEYSTLPVDEAIWRNGGVVFRHPTSYVMVVTPSGTSALPGARRRRAILRGHRVPFAPGGLFLCRSRDVVASLRPPRARHRRAAARKGIGRIV